MNRIVSGMAVLLLLCMAEKGKSQNSDMGPNLINNSYIYLLDGSKPAGYNVDGNITIEAVHPFTKGFEGPYCPTAPAGAAASVDAATASTPYWFGVYNKGGRISRGGLADGWGGCPDGHILKITGNSNSNNCYVTFPFERNVFPKTYRFRAWIAGWAALLITSRSTSVHAANKGRRNGLAGRGSSFCQARIVVARACCRIA